MRLEEILDDEPEYKTKKQVKKQVIFTETPDATYNKHEIQPCKNNNGLICYGDSYKDVLAGMLGAETIYLDIETTSCDRDKTSLNPWKNCWPCGFAIIAERFIDGVEECSLPYYIPVNKYNEQGVYDLLWKIFSHSHCKKWVNHNIKYDCHVLYNCAGIEMPEHIKIVDTLTLAKLIDSDRFRYGLDALSKDWLNIDISEYEAALKPYLQTKGSSKNKDYGLIPIDIIGPYACQDVITNRLLYKYICNNLPESCNYVRDIEIDLTRILTEIERNGLHVEIKQLQRTEMQNTFKLLEIEKRLERITKGKVFRPHCNADVYDILCNFYSLPVLKWTNSDTGDTGDTNNKNDRNNFTGLEEPEEYLEKDDKPCNASFDKHAIAAYLSHPVVLSNPRIKAVVKYIAMYRKINTFNNLFVKQYQELATGDLLHPFYNQCVRTGRLSCSKPNSQQLDENAKDLILPYGNIYNNIMVEENNITIEENLFVSFDESQIEYRTITHYIESPYLIEAYNENYDVDFHQFVADLVKEATGLDGMTRKPAKTLNFGLSFGMGKAKLLKSLEGNLDLMSSLIKEINESDIEENKKEEVFHRFAAQRAEKVFTTYHRLFPEIKQTSRKATAVCEQRGYIYNLFGRRRHLPYKFSYRAFNTVNQSSAADILKERMVYTGNLIRGSLIKLCASVHDELLFCMPKRLAEDTRVLHTIANMLENPIFPLDSDGNEKKLSVPLRVSCGIGKTWKQANKSAKVLQYDNVVSIEEFKQLIFE